MKNYGSLLKSKLLRNNESNRLIKNPHITIKTKIRNRQLHPMSSIFDSTNNEPSIKTQYEKYKKPQNILNNNTFNILSTTTSTKNSNNNSKHHYSKMNSKNIKFPQKEELLNKLRDISLITKFRYLKAFKALSSYNNNSHCISKNNSHFNSIKNIDLKSNVEYNKLNLKKNYKLPQQYLSLNIDLSHQARQSRNTKNKSFSKENDNNKKKINYNIIYDNSNYRFANTSGNNTLLNTFKNINEITKSPIGVNSKTVNYQNKFNMNKKLYCNIFDLNGNSNLNLNKKKFWNKDHKTHTNKIFCYTDTTSQINLNKKRKQHNKKNPRNTIENYENNIYLNKRPKKIKSTTFLKTSMKKKKNKTIKNHKNKNLSRPTNEINKKNNKELFKKLQLNKKVSGKLLNKNFKNIQKEKLCPKSNKNISPKDNNYINKNKTLNNNQDIMFHYNKNISLINSKKSFNNFTIEQNKKFFYLKLDINRNNNLFLNLKPSYQVLKTENHALYDNNFNYKKKNIIINDDSTRYNEIIPLRFSLNQTLEKKKIKTNNNEKALDETETPLSPITETTNKEYNNSVLTFNEVKDIIIYYDMDDIDLMKKNYLFKKNSKKMFKTNLMNKYAVFFFGK